MDEQGIVVYWLDHGECRSEAIPGTGYVDAQLLHGGYLVGIKPNGIDLIRATVHGYQQTETDWIPNESAVAEVLRYGIYHFAVVYVDGNVQCYRVSS